MPAVPQICINFPMRAVKHFDKWIGDTPFATIATTVERLGFDAVALAEHPYPPDAWLANGGHHAFDPFVGLAAWATATERLRLMTGLIVAAYRNPYVAAKAASSLDYISNGRVILGMGTGYLKDEFEAVGADYAHRGKILDESIRAMRAAWSNVDYDGEMFASTGHTTLPQPKQVGGPPIWVGGNSGIARRRAVELCEGWMPIAQNEEMAAITKTPALTDFESLAAQVGEVNGRRIDLGKAPVDVAFTPFEAKVLRGGTIEQFCDELEPRVSDYLDAGVGWLMVEPTSRSFADFERDLTVLSDRLGLVS